MKFRLLLWGQILEILCLFHHSRLAGHPIVGLLLKQAKVIEILIFKKSFNLQRFR